MSQILNQETSQATFYIRKIDKQIYDKNFGHVLMS